VAELARRFGDRFGQRVFGPDEWRTFHARPHSLAARFAAKEAVIKALGSPNMALHEIRVVRAPGSRPEVELVGRAQQRATELGVRRVALSISHSHAYAVAVALVERDDAAGA
jgi:holo-[acyl-carrier protein] synthase